jgi:hypothetical protein
LTVTQSARRRAPAAIGRTLARGWQPSEQADPIAPPHRGVAMSRLAIVRFFGTVLATLFAVSCGGGGAGGPSQPVISADAPSGKTGVPYPTYGFTVTSGGQAPFAWAETGNLPPGLSLSSTGELSGTPTTAGTFPITVTVTDSSVPPLTASAPVNLMILDSPIVISTVPAPPAGTLTHPYAGYTFMVGSGGSPPFTWAVSKGTPPPGMTVGSNGSLSGTPTSAGSFPFTVTATDSASTPGTGSQLFTVEVNTPPPPVVNLTPAPPSSVADSVYAFTLTASGGYLPLSWAVTAGALPPGLTLGASGDLSGTPTTIGSFPFTVTVTDGAAEKNSALLTIGITAPPPPAINDTPVPTGTVGTAYPAFQFMTTNGYLPLIWSEAGPLPGGLSLSPGGVLSGTPTQDGEFPVTVNVTDALNRSAPGLPVTVRVSLARPAAAFTPTTGSMTVARTAHTATLLTSGSVLVTGGLVAGAANATAELYNPTSETFAATGNMTVARSGHTATLLADPGLPNYGSVLVTSGGSQTAELYDPTSGMFKATGSTVTAHDEPTATLLQNGLVLIAWGGTASAELYKSASGSFAATGSMTVPRSGQTATLLPNGQVLIAGGGTATAELYDPTSATFTATGSMSEARTGHTATLLTNAALPNVGEVLIAGPDLTAEVFDPATGTFSPVGYLLTATNGSTANLRNDGTVLVAGGYIVESLYRFEEFMDRTGCYALGSAKVSIKSAELFAPESEGFTATGSLNTARYGHTATVLADGTVLVTGGVMGTLNNMRCGAFYKPFSSFSTVLSTAELFK